MTMADHKSVYIIQYMDRGDLIELSTVYLVRNLLVKLKHLEHTQSHDPSRMLDLSSGCKLLTATG